MIMCAHVPAAGINKLKRLTHFRAIAIVSILPQGEGEHSCDAAFHYMSNKKVNSYQGFATMIGFDK